MILYTLTIPKRKERGIMPPPPQRHKSKKDYSRQPKHRNQKGY